MKDKNPLTITIFGATGDLAQKKLIPSLFDLYKKDLLPDQLKIVGFSRKDLSDEEYRDFMRKSLAAKGHDKEVEKDVMSGFLNKAHYKQGDINEMESYKDLAMFLSEKDEEIKACSNKLFYLAVPPNLYEPVFSNISKSGMAMPCKKHSEDKRWTRVLVEKPFGSDMVQAEKLDDLLGKLFDEDQVFRIDHYLAKETLQNILTFRFANSMFESIWNNSAIESVSIKLHEESGIRDRGSFYDGLGALRDVGQNHILQMLALIAMEDPKTLIANDIRQQRALALKKVSLFENKIDECIVRGQYEGYKEVNGVENDSNTETYFHLKLGMNNKRWKGVPFYIESGKALKESKTEIEITFKELESCACPENDHRSHKNKIVFRVQPNEGINILFWAKKPGFKYELEEKNMEFDYIQGDHALPDAYERVLYDGIRGDQTLFISTDEVRAEWSIITPIIEKWKNVPLKIYEQGSAEENINN